MTKLRRVAALIIIMLSMIATAGCNGNNSSPPALPKQTETNAKTLTIYCGVAEDQMLKLTEEFTKDTGIKVTAVHMKPRELLGRITAEKLKPQASVWFGGPVETFIQAKTNGLLEKYQSPNAKNIPAEFKDADAYWTGISFDYLGFASNKKLLEAQKIAAPTCWQELLQPKLTRQIISSAPDSSRAAYTLLSTIVQMMGEKKGLAYMIDLNKQIKNYQQADVAPSRLAGQGECIVGITFLHDAVKYREEGMKDLIITVPVDGAGYEISAVGLLKSGPEPLAARKFIDWCLTAKAQKLGQASGAYHLPTNPEALPPQQLQELHAVKLIKYDFNWAVKNRTSLIDKWNDAIKQ